MKVALKKQVRIEQSETKTILIDNSSGDFYECSESALLLLKALLKGTTRKALVQILFSAYDVEESTAHAEVERCLSVLMTLGMLDEAV